MVSEPTTVSKIYNYLVDLLTRYSIEPTEIKNVEAKSTQSEPALYVVVISLDSEANLSVSQIRAHVPVSVLA